MDDLLTTRQLQEMLRLDRITIYRMLADGRLHGFKVGGQWRFSRRGLEAWLQGRQAGAEPVAPTAAAPEARPSAQVLPLSCVRAIQGVCAEALGVAAVTADLGGTPLVELSNGCGFCALVRSTEEGRRRCSASWASGGEGHPFRCHAGLLCATARIEVEGQPVALAAVCQFRAEDGPPPDVRALAEALDLPEAQLRAAADGVWALPPDHVPRAAALVRRLADTFAEIGQERLALLGRLEKIAEMSRI